MNPPIELKSEEKLAFGIKLPDGKTIYTILLPGDHDSANWDESMEWAKSIGGDLPDRAEQSLFFKYIPDEFRVTWYWSNTLHAEVSDCAWSQVFHNGLQYGNVRSGNCRSRAVHRVIQ